ncbi:MAG: c-type cytochrome [Gammaproteobacteria bacterium]
MVMHPIAVAVALSAVLFSQAVSADPMKTFEGRKLFQSLCSLCHGPEGKGDGPLTKKMDVHPADLTSERTKARSDEELRAFIAGTDKHEPGRVMPRWGTMIRKTDIDAVLTYVRFLQQSKHRLTGDPVLGRTIYNDYCVVCHGEAGKGDGIQAALIPVKPADHTNAERMDQLSNQELATMIINGSTYMPAWGSILSPTEIHGVIAYIRLLAFKQPESK